MSDVQGKVAVVTGAGSGIGRALSLELARRGARLALSDMNEGSLADTARVVGAEVSGAKVHTHQLDVADNEAFGNYADTVVAHYGVVHQLYNNAGIGGGRTILESDFVMFERVLAVNLWGVIYGTKWFLPHIIKSGDGHVINVSSLNGYMAQRELAAYCTSKFGVRGFTETLAIEMRAGKLPVGVTVVHPGGVHTNIATASLEMAPQFGIEVTERDRRRVQIYNDKLLRMDPAQAANIIIDGVEANKSRVRVGNDAKLVDLIVRLFPSSYGRVLALMDRLTLGKS
jgi:NAD(P)-dependent dehydrogenase (short-subunit alcohol dehydrogenase family)